MLKTVLVLVLIPFSALSAAVLWQVGYLGLFTQQFANYGSQQILADLVIAVFICMYWMWCDAKKSRRNPLAVDVAEPGGRLVRPTAVFDHSQGPCE